VRASFDARLASGEFQQVIGQKHDTGRQITTAEILAEMLERSALEA